MLVEVQLHLRAIFELKHDLHTLYNGVRVLGASDDEVILHKGELTIFKDSIEKQIIQTVKDSKCSEIQESIIS